MLVVLVDWVHELMFFAIDRLCPCLAFSIPKNPTIHVLCFYDEDADKGYQAMINLSCLAVYL